MAGCIECKYVGFLSGDLTCWRNAPLAHSESCPDCSGFTINTVQPPVQPDDWCGEYVPASIKHMTQTRRTFEAIQREIAQMAQQYIEERNDDGDTKVVTLRNAKPRGSA